MKTVTVKGSDMLAAMKALPDRSMGNPGKAWTDQQIKALLYGWPRKPQRAVAKVVRHNVSSCRDKFRELTSAAEKK
jgi:hypothetical protein